MSHLFIAFVFFLAYLLSFSDYQHCLRHGRLFFLSYKAEKCTLAAKAAAAKLNMSKVLQYWL